MIWRQFMPKKIIILYSLIMLSLFTVLPPQSFGDSMCTEEYGGGSNQIKVATGSLGRLGLLKALADAYNESYDTTICFIYAGSGEALQLLKNKKVDLILVHSEKAEIQAVKEGWADKRTLIGSNEYCIVGPKDDPAGIKKIKTAVDAYKQIADKKVKFFSRGDNSGTHVKEMEIWKEAGVVPSGKWYIVTKNNMTETLKVANKQKGYFMPENTTWFIGKHNYPSLDLLLKGDTNLLNIYHIVLRKYNKTDYNDYAIKFHDFVKSEKGQEIIRNFGKEKYGISFFNDAKKTKSLIE